MKEKLELLVSFNHLEDPPTLQLRKILTPEQSRELAKKLVNGEEVLFIATVKLLNPKISKVVLKEKFKL